MPLRCMAVRARTFFFVAVVFLGLGAAAFLALGVAVFLGAAAFLAAGACTMQGHISQINLRHNSCTVCPVHTLQVPHEQAGFARKNACPTFNKQSAALLLRMASPCRYFLST